MGLLQPLGWPLHLLLIEDIIDYAFEHKDESRYDQMLITPVSHSTRLLNRRRTAKEIIHSMVKEAARILEEGLAKTAG